MGGYLFTSPLEGEAGVGGWMTVSLSAKFVSMTLAFKEHGGNVQITSEFYDHPPP
jgi:hypothetical protein